MHKFSRFFEMKILKEIHLKKRAKLLKYFIEIIKEVEVMNEFNLMMFLVSGLTTHSIGRLVYTRDLIDERSRDVIEELCHIYDQYTYDLNYSADNLCIGTLGGISHILCYNQSSTDQNLIDWVKRKKFHETVEHIFSFQKQKYNFTIHKEFQEIFMIEFEEISMNYIQDEAYKLSCKIEPRGADLKDILQ